MIGIIDFGMGNLSSVKRKLDRIGAESVITCIPDEITSCTGLVLPGVGSFAKAVTEIKKRGLWNVLNEQVLHHKIPTLGICLGMQLMASFSEEGDAEGFGWIDAKVIKFRVRDPFITKVPHTGWNRVRLMKYSLLFHTIQPDSEFYFVHSYHLQCNDPSDILTVTTYDYDFVSGVEKGNITGIQFHPEKSHDSGEEIFKNFLSLI